MFQKNNIVTIILLNFLIAGNIICQRLSNDLLGGWGEKVIDQKTPDFGKSIEAVEKYLVSEGYTLEEIHIIPVGFFKQVVNGINYRVLAGVKKKSSLSTTIYDIHLRKTGDDIKFISSKNPNYGSTQISDKNKKLIKNAIFKYFIAELYEVKGFEVQYEYHKIDGLHDYAIYDVEVELSNKDNNSVNKRVLVVYRNDKTFMVQEELKTE